MTNEKARESVTFANVHLSVVSSCGNEPTQGNKENTEQAGN